MAKLSKSMQWVLILAITGGTAAFFLTEQEGGGKRAKPKAVASKSTAPEGFKEEDMTARFPRLNAPVRNVFVPKVATKKAQPAAAAPHPAIGVRVKPTWSLTGIYVQNGTRLALLENSSTGESQTLAVGQSWQGQPIIAIKTDGILFANGTRMVFEEPEEAEPAAVAPVVLPSGTTPGAGVRPGVAAADTAPNRPITINLPPGVAPTQPTGSRP